MLRNVRINLFSIAAVLVALGIVMIYSSSSIYAFEKYHDGFFFLKRHLFFILLGIFFIFLIMIEDYRKLRKFAHPLIFIAIILLILVLIPGIGREVSGARRWFRFKFLSFQPSEFANLALIIYLADFISRKESLIRSFRKGFAPALCMIGTISFLLLLQPDLGSAIALSAVALLMLYIAGTKPSYLFSLLLISIPFLYLLIFRVAYRRARILSFLNPWMDPQGSGFQLIQSQIALGSGKLFGVGLGHSRQKLFYLPAAHTDFIFSIIGEELGLFGTVGVVVLFMLLIYEGIKIIKNASDRFGYFLSLGIVLMFSFKALINIGVSCGLFPTKGLPLPFISYGGSSFVFDMISLGLLANIARTGEFP